ncbi:NAD(P)H-dependent oxidoreductase [Natronoglycomyces albus]|uniref:NAD(P)H-dependent oxidoreductase n=1 Tax=Natronoglycomyces albus TaxID=2811108 RepID=A0A895XQK9_9ACTN|nr:NAD(P)H-dependent oxidoreductase [Natronoglycomyces albus]QSB05435.1 NAD(P)H-dependent oxidoreductase [Natronoglycomyces albus]
MKFFVLYAHPDHTSLSASLHRDSVSILRELGHEVTVSDLYAMKWKATADYEDLGELDEHDNFTDDSGLAMEKGQLAADIVEEQRKISEADAVLVQFPLWWFSMPAIMKGWFDRVFSNGFAYGTTRSWPRYGNGKLQGKKAMVMLTMGAGTPAVSERGVSGDLNDILFPLQRGTLHYAGMDPVPPFVVPSAYRMDEERYSQLKQQLRQRLETWEPTAPIGYRCQNGGDYDEQLRLKPGLEPTGVHSGYKLHIAS